MIRARSRRSTIVVGRKGHIAWNTYLVSLVRCLPLTPKTTVVSVGHRRPFEATLNYWMACIPTDLFSSIVRAPQGSLCMLYMDCLLFSATLRSLFAEFNHYVSIMFHLFSFPRGPKSVCLLCLYLVRSNTRLPAILAQLTWRSIRQEQLNTVCLGVKTAQSVYGIPAQGSKLSATKHMAMRSYPCHGTFLSLSAAPEGIQRFQCSR